MTSGELDARVTFYEPRKVTDTLRGQAVEYDELCTVACQWRGLTSRELMLAQAMTVVPQYRVTVRYVKGLTVQHRAEKVGGDDGMCQVVSVTRIDNDRYLELDVVKVL
jgi:SPP1 family predicted phage head-tail adaptor